MILTPYFIQKYPASVGYFCWKHGAILIVLAITLASCVRPPKTLAPQAETAQKEETRNIATVVVQRENIRNVPNGEILGEVKRGDRASIITPRGNWMYCQIDDTLDAYIWAPSLGFLQVSYLDIHTYFPGSGYGLLALDTLIQRLGPPSEISQESPHYQKVVYDNMPQEGRYPFGTSEFRHINLSVTHDLIAEVSVDLGAKEIRQRELLGQMGLPDVHPTYTGFREVLWDDVFNGLGRVSLERAGGSFASFSAIHVYKVNPERWKRELTLAKQFCQIGENGEVTVHITIVNGDSLAYSDILSDISFFDSTKSMIYQAPIGPLPDIVLPHGIAEIFVNRIVTEVMGRTDANYIIRMVSAKPLFVSPSP